MKRSAWAAFGLVGMAGGIAACGQALELDECEVLDDTAPECISTSSSASSSSSSGGGSDVSECVAIPAGTFMMGSDNGFANEKPVHSVTVAAFCMDRTEVTVAAYDACVKAGKCTPAQTGVFYNAGVTGRENHPINGVDWDQATAYCKAQGKRLPTEEEWEYAARGTDGREYPWGNEAPSNQLCWDRDDSTCPVGAYPDGASPFGLEDMSGNVSEWTSSALTPDYASPPYASHRVYRGGSWYYGCDPSCVRSATRRWDEPSYLFNILGFRCAGASPD